MEDLTSRSRDKSYEEDYDGDIVSRLQEKVKTQAQRLRALEQYKVLCETRLTELFPSHPVPVRNEHLGTTSPAFSQELHAAKQKIIRLEQQLSQQGAMTPRSGTPGPGTPMNAQKIDDLYTALYHKHNETLREKAAVEESLRAEMLASEEQRIYIEILKQAIEINAEELGLAGIGADTFVEFIENKTNADEIRKSTAKMQSAVLDQEIQIQKLNEEINERIEECKEMADAKETMEKQLNQAIEALQYAEDEAQKLEIERNSLIDYIDEHKKKGDFLADNLNKTEEKYEEVAQQFKQIANEHENLHKSKKETEAELESAKAEIAKYEKSLRDLQTNFINVKTRIEEKDKQLNTLKENLNGQTSRNEALELVNQEITQRLKEFEESLTETCDELDRTKSDKSQLEIDLAQTTEELKQSQSELQEAEDLIKELKENLEEKTNKNTELNSTVESNSKQIEELNSEVQKAWTEQKETYQREQNLIKVNNDLHTKLSDTQQRTEILQSEIEDLNNDLLELKERYETNVDDLNNLSEIRKKLEQELMKAEIDLSSEKSNARYAQDEVFALKSRIEDLNLALKISNENYQDKDDKLRSSGYKNDELNDEINRAKQEINEQRYEKQIVEEALRKIKIDNERFRQEKAILEEQLAECCKTGSELIEKIKECDLSKDLMEFIAAWNDLPSDVLSIQRLLQLSLANLYQLSQQNAKNMSDLLCADNQLQTSLIECETLAKEEASLRSRESFLRSQIDQIYQENSRIRETMNAQITSLHQEVILLRSDIHKLHDENEVMDNELRIKSQECTRAKQAEEYYKRTLDEKNRLFIKHKQDFEDIIRGIWKAKNIESQRAFEQIMRVRAELEHTENDKSRILEQIYKLTEEGDSQIRDSLKKQAANCEEQIEVRKGLVKRLEEEIRANESKDDSKKLNGDRRSYIYVEEEGASGKPPLNGSSSYRSQYSEE